MRDETYETMADIGKEKFNDGGFCGIIATATACRVTFGKAYQKWKEVGRRNGKGTQWFYATKIFKGLGYNLETVVDYISYNRKDLNPEGFKMGTTSKVVRNKDYQKGVYLIRTRQHIFAMVNGKVNDWNPNKKVGHGSRSRVTNIYKVTAI